MLARHSVLSASLLLLGAPLTCCAQFLEKADFEGGVERAATKGPRTAWANGPFCRFVIDLSVDRGGRLLSAAVNVPLSSCSDTALVNKANALARTYVFAPSALAPEPQAARFVWTVGERPQLDDLEHMVVGDPDRHPAPPQVPDAPDSSNEVFTIVEEMPEFPGGQGALMKYLVKEVEYPKEAMDAKMEGTVYISFIVERDGKIAEVKTLRGLGSGLSQEAVRVAKGMPNWMPGKQNGKPVRVRYTLPIRFKLNSVTE